MADQTDLVVPEINKLSHFLAQEEPELDGWARVWQGKRTELEISGALAMIVGLLVYVWLLPVNDLIFLVLLGGTLILILLCWYLLETHHKREREQKSDRSYLTLFECIRNVLGACGWLGEDQWSIALRQGVTVAHVRALGEILCRKLPNNLHRQTMLDLAKEKKWPTHERVGVMLIRLDEAYSQYNAVLDSVNVDTGLLAIAKALQDNSTSGLATNAISPSDLTSWLVALIDGDADGGVVTPPFDNGLTANQTASLVGQLQGIAEHMDELHKSLMAQLAPPVLLEEGRSVDPLRDAAELEADGELGLAAGGGMDKL